MAGAKLQGKTEILPGKCIWYSYNFDDKGRLIEARRDNLLVEEYQYNERGQRIRQCRRAGLDSGNSGGRVEERLCYDERGRLTAGSGKFFDYDERGALAEIVSAEGTTKFYYQGDTMLDKVVLPGGTKVRYEYAGIHPVRRYRYHTLTGEYQWSQQGRLVKYHDHDLRLEYSFTYAADGALDTVTLRSSMKGQTHGQGVDWAAVSADWRHSMSADKAREVVEEFLDAYVQPFQPLTLRCGCDQVGSVRVLLDSRGDVVKEVLYDSFGQRLSDSFPELYMPLGFACGLHDPDTHLVRFGWRDYDPSVGRFTAPDPARDRRGDGDLYDYCADDPVSRIDPTGLAWDESLHPRDDVGQFTGDGSTETRAAAPDSATSAKESHQDGSSKEGKGVAAAIFDAIRPWWSYPYGHPQKTQRITELEQSLKPRLEGFAQSFLTIDKLDPKSQLLEYGVKELTSLSKTRRQK